jgi:hypothetical protein
MKQDIKEEVEVVLSLLKTTMSRNNLVFGIMVDKKDGNKSQIAFLDKDSLMQGRQDGILVSLDEMNK